MMVGERIKSKRKELGLTLKELSSRINISVSFLSDIENCRSNPSLERLKEIAEGLGCTVSFLLGENFLEKKEVYSKEGLKHEINEGVYKLFNDAEFVKILNEFKDFKTWSDQEKNNLLDFLQSMRTERDVPSL